MFQWGSWGVPEPNTATELAQPWCVALLLRHLCRRGVLGYPLIATRLQSRKRLPGFCQAWRGSAKEAYASAAFGRC